MIRSRYFQWVSKRLLSDSNNKIDGLIMGLTKKADGTNRISSDEEEAVGDSSFEVLSLLQKNKDNRRFNIRHIRNAYDSDSYIDQKAEADVDDEETNKHKAPQHRRYLTFPTVSSGTPIQRYKMNQTQRLNKAVVNTNKYQMEKLGIVDQDVGMNMLTRNTGSQLASEIEDKIQLSILKGDFDNLKNQGKPLIKYENALVDRTTDLAFEILKKNGITPEWVELQKIVYSLKEDLRARLKIEWCKLIQSLNTSTNNGNNTTPIIMPSSTDIDNIFYNKMTTIYSEDEAIINKKNDDYNLIVPSHYLTRARISLKLEIANVVSIKFTNLNEVSSMLSNNIEICNSYDSVRIASRLDINSTYNDVSMRPMYHQHLHTTYSRYNGNGTIVNNDKTLSGGKTTTTTTTIT